MRGIWTSRAAKGTYGIGTVGNVAFDEDGRKAYDDFLKLLMAVKQHSRYNELKKDSKDAWMMPCLRSSVKQASVQFIFGEQFSFTKQHTTYVVNT